MDSNENTQELDATESGAFLNKRSPLREPNESSIKENSSFFINIQNNVNLDKMDVSDGDTDNNNEIKKNNKNKNKNKNNNNNNNNNNSFDSINNFNNISNINDDNQDQGNNSKNNINDFIVKHSNSQSSFSVDDVKEDNEIIEKEKGKTNNNNNNNDNNNGYKNININNNNNNSSIGQESFFSKPILFNKIRFYIKDNIIYKCRFLLSKISKNIDLRSDDIQRRVQRLVYVLILNKEKTIFIRDRDILVSLRLHLNNSMKKKYSVRDQFDIPLEFDDNKYTFIIQKL